MILLLEQLLNNKEEILNSKEEHRLLLLLPLQIHRPEIIREIINILLVLRDKEELNILKDRVELYTLLVLRDKKIVNILLVIRDKEEPK